MVMLTTADSHANSCTVSSWSQTNNTESTSFIATLSNSVTGSSVTKGTSAYVVSSTSAAPSCSTGTQVPTANYNVTTSGSGITFAPASSYAWTSGTYYAACLTAGVTCNSASLSGSNTADSFNSTFYYTPAITWAPSAGIGPSTTFTTSFGSSNINGSSVSTGTNVWVTGPSATTPGCAATKLGATYYSVTAGTSSLSIAPSGSYSWVQGQNYSICLATGSGSIKDSFGNYLSTSTGNTQDNFVVPAWNSAITWAPAVAGPSFSPTDSFTATFGSAGTSGIAAMSAGSNAYVVGPSSTNASCSGSHLATSNYSLTTSPSTNPTGVVFTPAGSYLWGSGSSYALCFSTGSGAIQNTSGVPLSSGSTGTSYTFLMPAFLISGENPAAGATTSAPKPPISITFTYPVSSSGSTLNNLATLTDMTMGGTFVANLSGTVGTGANNNIVSFSGVPILTDLHTYQVTLNCPNIVDATGSAGNLSAWSGCTGSPSTFSWQFSLEATNPTVGTITTSSTPVPVMANGSNWLASKTPVFAIPFSEAMQTATVTSSSNICLLSGAGPFTSCSGALSGTTLSYSSANNNTVTLQAPSLSDGTYTVYVGTGVLNRGALSLLTAVPYTFVVDTTAPIVASISPANGATNIGTNNVPIVIKFTETGSGVNVNTLNNIALVDQNGNNIAWSQNFSAATQTLTMTPAGGLNTNSTYTVNISSNVTDYAGNPMVAYTSSFSTPNVTASTYVAYPSFMCSSIQPNVLIILDNSNSFDFDLNGNAVGSPHCTNTSSVNTCSKSVLAREALINMINTYGNKMRIGLMSYQLPTNIASDTLSSNVYFASYDPRTSCPAANPALTDTASVALRTACQNYCINEEPNLTWPHAMSANESACQTGCSAGNTAFQTNIRDAITTTAGTNTAGTAEGSAARTSYCGLIYPKWNSYKDSNSVTVYYGEPGSLYQSGSGNTAPFYFYSAAGTGSSNYNTAQFNPVSNSWPSPGGASYTQCTGHTGSNSQSGFTGCSGSYGFVPDDNDEGLGFFNFGPSNAGAYVSKSFLSLTSPGGGFLNVPVDTNDSLGKHVTNLLTLLGSTSAAPADYLSETDYMTCSNLSSPNVSYLTAGSTTPTAAGCGHLINAGMTPTWGTLQNALQYLNGTFKNSGAATTMASPIQYSCQKNYIVLVTDGSPDTNLSGSTVGAPVVMPSVLSQIDAFQCPTSGATSANCQVQVAGTKYNVPIYVLGMGLQQTDQANVNSMAVHGGTAVNGQAYLGNDATSFMNSLYGIFNNIIAQTGSGTAASILNNSQGSGSSLLQAVFYPSKVFDVPTMSQGYWLGEMQNLWYYIDPMLNNTTIREDTVHDYQLNLQQDDIVQFNFDQVAGQTTVNVYADPNGNGTPSSTPVISGESPDAVNSLWRAGLTLWRRNLSTDPRTIYTGYNSTAGGTPQLFSSNTGAGLVTSPTLLDLLQVKSQAKAVTLINYMLGSDQPPDSDGTQYRTRKVLMSGCGLTDTEGCTREWKLSDIVSSTPKLVSSLPLGTYHLAAPGGYGDSTYAAFVASSTYQTRGMALVGANDGMLHAFKLGTLKEQSGKYLKAEITDSSGNLATAATNLGREEWAFVPTGVLPYLTYYASTSYDHIFSVDRTPTLVDASIGVTSAGCSGDYSTCPKNGDGSASPTTGIGSTWRTIVIGGMGAGGAPRTSDQTTCNSITASSGSGVNGNTTTCYQSPLSNAGLSSYFALDVTDPENPKYLWEFAGSKDGSGNYLGDLGAATTGPVIIREAYRDSNGIIDNSKNGKWYAVFASGPTGPINTSNHSFLGQSDQNLKVFVVDLATGALVKSFDAGAQLGVTNAFAGSLTTNAVDTDRPNTGAAGFYSDDVVYIGYTQLDTTLGTWTKGGVLRLTTANFNDPTSSAPSTQWNLSTLINGTGPVTTAIAKLQDTAASNLWIYFGTGRFFYNGDDPSTAVQALYGIKDPCYNGTAYSSTCTTQVTGTLVNQTGSATSAPSQTIASNAPGWSVTLSAATSTNLSERVISDPTASPSGAVFFTTFVPNLNPCQYGGSSYIWALGYNSGGVPPATAMKGQALLQVSTGALQQVALSTAFQNPGNMGYNGRRLLNAVTGMPPVSQGMALIANPKPVKRIVHIREK